MSDLIDVTGPINLRTDTAGCLPGCEAGHSFDGPGFKLCSVSVGGFVPAVGGQQVGVSVERAVYSDAPARLTVAVDDQEHEPVELTPGGGPRVGGAAAAGC